MNDTKNDDFYIGKIKNDLEFIIDHTAEKMQKDIESDELLNDSIMLRIMRISEITDKLTEQFKSAHKEIPWSNIKGLADKIVHDYDDSDLALVYDAVFHGIPDMYEKMKCILIDSNTNAEAEMTDDEKIDLVSARILKEYREAFEELAK
ncbi:MAG: DUF86 domain-containing protein [Clostridia bacterium]|nr:DUF86 domain-containing protein [Clostridia bacterium]